MNIRAILFLAVAALGVLLVVMATRSYLAGQTQRPTQEAPKVQVLVAARDLPPGTIMGAADVVWRDWPDSGIDANYISKGSTKAATAQKDIEKAKTEEEKAKLRDRDTTNGKVVRVGFAAGEPITRSSIVAPGERGYIAAALTPGMRATTVQVNNYTGVGGFARPGDRVDVILTHDVQRTAYENGRQIRRMHTVSETVMENVRLLALNDSSEAKPADGKKKKAPSSVTVELPPAMVERILVLDEIGDLSLSLRSLAAAGVPDGDQPRDVSGSYAVDSDIGNFMPKMGDVANDDIITVYRGSNVTRMVPLDTTQNMPVKRTGSGGASLVGTPTEGGQEINDGDAPADDEGAN